jgi:hypothetical protein
MRYGRLLTLVLATVLFAACDQASEMIPDGDGVNPVAEATEATPILVNPGSTPGADTSTPTPTIQDYELARSVVQIHILDTKTLIRTIRDGSGVIIDGDAGLILTAYSLVQPYLDSGARAYSTIAIGVNHGNGVSPRRAYEAVLVAANAATDLAVLRVTRAYQGDPLPAGEVDLVGAEIGAAGLIEPGDQLRLFGHPGELNKAVESQALQVTDGTVTGRRGQANLPGTTRLKLDARLSYGATGGPAFDVDGALIGILVPEHYDISSPVSQLRPIELAEQLIIAARQLPSDEEFVAPLIVSEPPGGFDAPLATDGSWISRPAFAENATNLGSQLDLLDYQLGFLSGTQTLCFEFVVQGLTNDTLVEERWFLNDVLQDSISSSYAWSGNDFTIMADRIEVPATFGFPDGFWRLEIWTDRELRAASTAVIGVTPPPPTITNIQFGALAAANGRKLTNAVAGADQLLMFFDYSGMEVAHNVRWLVFHDGELEKYQSNEVTWSGGGSGRFWVGYTGPAPIEPGTWRFELFVDGESRGESEIVLP